MEILSNIWSYFATNILQQPAFMIGFIVLIGYILLWRPWYDILAGTIKAIVGYLILTVGSGGLTNNFRPVLVGLGERFNISATVIDPYFGQNAVTAGVEEVFGKGFGDAMILLFIAFIVNILLVRFTKFTKLRALFTTGNVQVQQAATAYWLIMFALPGLLAEKMHVPMLIVMALLLGAYWAVGSNLTIKPCQEVTDGAGFALAHQQMFGVAFFYWLAGKLFGNEGKHKDKKVKKIEDLELPGSVPGVDCAVIFGFSNANAVTLGFLFGFLGQILAIVALILLKSPVLIICGFVPVFFDNATIGVFVNQKGGLKAVIILPFISGLCQVFGSALIAGWVGMAAYGGYLGMWDWAVVWPVFTVVMKYLSYAGVAIIFVALLAIPQIQYRKDKEGYFLMTEDYEAYKELKAKKASN